MYTIHHSRMRIQRDILLTKMRNAKFRQIEAKYCFKALSTLFFFSIQRKD